MSSPIFDTKAWTSVSRPGDSLNIRPSSGARGEEILDSLPFSLPSFPFSPGQVWSPGGGGALGYFLGGYVPPGTPNWHPVLEKFSPKTDTPF